MSEYIIDPILPTREVHLIGGPSGVGKSTWGNQTLNSLTHGYPILNYPVKPTEWRYISCDRSAGGMERTLDRINLPLNREWFVTRRQLKADLKLSLLPGIEDMVKWCPAPLLFIEAFGLMIPKSNTANSLYQDTGSWLSFVGELCEAHNKTIIATVHSPKTKEGEKYADMRQRVLGSVAVAALVETIFLIERESPDITDRGRLVHLLPRNAAEQTFHYRLDDAGRFCLAPSPESQTTQFLIEVSFDSLPSLFNTGALVQAANAKGVSERSIYYWLKKALKEGIIEEVDRGRWKKLATKTEN